MPTCCPHCGAILNQDAPAAPAQATQRLDAASVTVRGQTMSMGQGQAQVFGGVDPALAKIDADRAKAVPMPESVRQANAILRADILAQRANKRQNLNKPKA